MFPKLAPGHDLHLLPSLKRTAVFLLGRHISSLKERYEIYMFIDFHLHNTQKKNHINGIYYVIYIHPLFGVFQWKPRKPPPNPQFPTGNEPTPSGLGFRRGTPPTEVPRRIQGEVDGSTLRRLATSLWLRITSLQLH